MYKIAICDDDENFLKEMSELVQGSREFTDEMVIECFNDGDDFLKENLKSYTLIFMDMCMKTLDGFSVAKKVREVNEDAVLVFCSGVVEPKPEHFEVQPYRYIVKSTDTKKAAVTVTEALKYMKQRYFKAYINVAGDGRAMKIDISRVLYFYPAKRGTILKVQEESKPMEFMELRSNQMIKDWHGELFQCGFDFVSTGYLVNLARIKLIEKNRIIMDDGAEILISRIYKKSFTQSFALFFDKKYRRDT